MNKHTRPHQMDATPPPPGSPVTSNAAAELLRQQHEIERLNAALKWEQDHSARLGTHGQGCHTWGPRHYECLLREYKVLLDALENARAAIAKHRSR